MPENQIEPPSISADDPRYTDVEHTDNLPRYRRGRPADGPPFDCDARIRPFPGMDEVACEKPDGEHAMHAGALRDYAYPGFTRVEWARDDRRSFHGPWPGPCPEAGCVLPAGHPRGHHVE